MKPGTYTHGAASVHLGYTQVVPVPMRGRVRELTSLAVAREARGQGAASALMQDVCAQADAAGLALMVMVEPFDGASMDELQLASWYSRLGFKTIQAAPVVIMVRRATKQ